MNCYELEIVLQIESSETMFNDGRKYIVIYEQ